MRVLRAIVLVVMLLGTSLPGEPAIAEPIPARPAIVRGNVWHLRDSLTAGFADTVFSYGRVGDRFLMGDWDGDGVKTPGAVRGNTWYLRNSNSSGFADVVFQYGRASDLPIAGDWDGNGTDTPGAARVQHIEGHLIDTCDGVETQWFLRNDNSTGVSDEYVEFGCPGDPIVGDWDGDGDDSPGSRQEKTNAWALSNALDGTLGATLFYGTASMIPIAGDWDGDGDETVGAIGEQNTWFLRNENTSGTSDVHFRYGAWTDTVFLVWGDDAT